MQITKIDTFTLTCKPERTADYLELIRKAEKTRKPTVRGGVKRDYPVNGAHLSTREYVMRYQAINGLLNISNAYDTDTLSHRVTPPEGVYTEDHNCDA